jgi:hypothetical protein
MGVSRMILISHRGNIDGKNLQKENTIDYILNAINLGYDVEIDVSYIDNKWFLGHDSLQEEINFSFLEKKGLWVHCKNFDAISKLYRNNNVNYFWHQNDNLTITSSGYIWAYPGNQPIINSIAVLPEIYEDETSRCIGICSDFIEQYAER